MKRFTSIITLFIAISINSFSQNMYFNTFSVAAEIVQHDVPNSEVSSFLDNSNNTHIAWIRSVGNNQYLMYSVYNNVTMTTVEIPTPSTTERKTGPYLILDANNHPHITYIVMRDPTNSSYNSGNYAIMYAGDPEGDGTFEISQVSTNPTSPSSNTENIFNCYVNGRPSIAMDGTNILVSYSSDNSSLTSNDHWIIFAIKNGTSWNRTQEFDSDIYGVTFGGDISLPYRMTPNKHNVWLDISNYNPRFNVKNGSTWNNIVQTQYSGYMNIYNTQIDYDDNNNIHFMWFSADSSKFYHTNINGSSIGTVEGIEIIGKKLTAGNFHPATVDIATGKLFMSYQRYNNSSMYIMTKDNSNNVIETEIPLIGNHYGRRCLNVKNNFISLVTASQTNGKIYVTTNTGSSSISEISNNEVSVFPNPASDIINLNIDNAYNTVLKINIYNVIGALVKSELLKQNQQQINISDLKKGIYMLEIKTKEWSKKQKLIIQR